MAAVQIAGVEVGPPTGGPVVRAVVTADALPARRRQWSAVAATMAQALVLRDCPVEGVYAVFDASSAVCAVLEFGKVLAVEEADQESLRRLGPGSTIAYAAVVRTRGGPRDGDKEPVLAVTIEVAPQPAAGLWMRLRGGRGGGSVVAAVGMDGQVRHVESSRRPGSVGGMSPVLAAAYVPGP